jgi:hypothetical protein
MEQMMMYTSCKSNYYLCYFLEIINDEKIQKINETDNDVYILHVKKYAISAYSRLER